MANRMHLDLYTQNSALTQKAKFWCNYVGALKGKENNIYTKIIIIFLQKIINNIYTKIIKHMLTRITHFMLFCKLYV